MPKSVSDLINGKAKVLDQSKFTELVKCQFYNNIEKKKTETAKETTCPKGDAVLFISFLKIDMFGSMEGVSICYHSTSSLHPFSLPFLLYHNITFLFVFF